MEKNRLEAFSDGVMAIVITLKLRPSGSTGNQDSRWGLSIAFGARFELRSGLLPPPAWCACARYAHILAPRPSARRFRGPQACPRLHAPRDWPASCRARAPRGPTSHPGRVPAVEPAAFKLLEQCARSRPVHGALFCGIEPAWLAGRKRMAKTSDSLLAKADLGDPDRFGQFGRKRHRPVERRDAMKQGDRRRREQASGGNDGVLRWQRDIAESRFQIHCSLRSAARWRPRLRRSPATCPW